MYKTRQEEPRYLSVTELVLRLRATLDNEFLNVCFQGEIFELTRAASGHVYFTLKDGDSQIKAVMWKGAAGALDFRPAVGSAVLCQGRPDIYPANGRLQMIVQRMLAAGAGDLQRKFLELKARLEKEGLFAEDRKRELPFFPQAIGVVTSGTGAVIHDVMVKIRERMPNLKVYLEDVRVQGEGAAEEIARGVRRLSDSGEVDVIIVARGGGSLEDLWSFNEEVVVRAIFASKVPVISGVGHEVDVTLADFAADVRAPTPTAAAEMVVPKREDLLREISELQRRLMDYERWFQPIVQRIDDLVARLERRVASALEEGRLRIMTAEARLKAIQPDKVISIFRSRLELCSQRLFNSCETNLGRVRHTLEKLAVKLEAVSPMRVLERGYALVEARGAIVRSAAQLEAGEELGISFWQGRIRASVLEKVSENRNKTPKRHE